MEKYTALLFSNSLVIFIVSLYLTNIEQIVNLI